MTVIVPSSRLKKQRQSERNWDFGLKETMWYLQQNSSANIGRRLNSKAKWSRRIDEKPLEIYSCAVYVFRVDHSIPSTSGSSLKYR